MCGMRILVISPRVSGIGGVARHVTALIERLRERGHEVRVVSRENTPIINVSGLRNPSFAVTASLKCAFRKYDIIHAHNFPAAVPMRAALGGRVFTIHGVYSEYIQITHGRLATRVARWLERKALEWADVITSVSKAAAEHYRRMGFDAVYVPNAIDLSKMPKGSKRLYKRQVVFAGRLSREKGLDVLIEVFRDIRGAHLIVIGKGPEESELRRLARECSNIHFLGFLKSHREVLEYIKGSDVFVLPSRTEGLPTVLLEAMACKVPVIATAVGGNTELVEDGVTGLLVPPDDPAALREALERLLTDEALASKIVENAYRRVVKEYSWDVVIEKYLQVYERVAPGKV